MSKIREVKQIIDGIKASDGDGVQLTRVIGTAALDTLDPFLLFDHFGSDQPQDYIGGFPDHPHRGFETVTYMLAGKMRHKDSAGNEGVIKPGGIQWMTAGKGIIHSEMPEQEEGLLSGFQLWVNLPAKYKMSEPKYQESVSAEIPVETQKDGSSIKVIAGKTINGTEGIIKNTFVQPNYWDIHSVAGGNMSETISTEHNAFIYVYEGNIAIGKNKQCVEQGQLAVLTTGDLINFESEKGSQLILISGKPINEPIARHGPFVMNTQQEIQQAFIDYQRGVFA